MDTRKTMYAAIREASTADIQSLFEAAIPVLEKLSFPYNNTTFLFRYELGITDQQARDLRFLFKNLQSISPAETSSMPSLEGIDLTSKVARAIERLQLKRPPVIANHQNLQDAAIQVVIEACIEITYLHGLALKADMAVEYDETITLFFCKLPENIQQLIFNNETLQDLVSSEPVSDYARNIAIHHFLICNQRHLDIKNLVARLCPLVPTYLQNLEHIETISIDSTQYSPYISHIKSLLLRFSLSLVFNLTNQLPTWNEITESKELFHITKGEDTAYGILSARPMLKPTTWQSIVFFNLLKKMTFNFGINKWHFTVIEGLKGCVLIDDNLPDILALQSYTIDPESISAGPFSLKSQSHNHYCMYGLHYKPNPDQALELMIELIENAKSMVEGMLSTKQPPPLMLDWDGCLGLTLLECSTWEDVNRLANSVLNYETAYKHAMEKYLEQRSAMGKVEGMFNELTTGEPPPLPSMSLN